MSSSRENFDSVLARAKENLSIQYDKDFAEILEINQKTFSRLKKAQQFPETELLALSVRRPDLNIDLDYIFTGTHSSDYGAVIRDAGLNQDGSEPIPTRNADERALILHFRNMPEHSQDALMHIATALSNKNL